MRNVKTLTVGDVIQASALSKDDYFLVIEALSAGEDSPRGYVMINIGDNRFVDTTLSRQKRIDVLSIETLGKVRRWAHYTRRVTFNRS